MCRPGCCCDKEETRGHTQVPPYREKQETMFSIIVLTHNNAELTKRCLESIRGSKDADWELCVVDNASSDGTRELLREMAIAFKRAGRTMFVLLNDSNVGCSTGRNLGISNTTGDFVVFMDNDVAVGDDGWLGTLRGTIESAPSEELGTGSRVGIVVPKLVFADNTGMIQCAGGAVSRTGRVQFVGRGEPADDPRFNVRRDVQFGISACMMLKRAVVRDIGLLDEAFNPVQFEDIDYCYRARSKGWRVVYEPSVTMLHDESATTAGVARSRNAYTVVKHGMLFKERWRHMFETEDGPDDKDIVWKPLGRFAKNDRME